MWVFNVHPCRFCNRFVTVPVETPSHLRVKVEVTLVMLAEGYRDYWRDVRVQGHWETAFVFVRPRIPELTVAVVGSPVVTFAPSREFGVRTRWSVLADGTDRVCSFETLEPVSDGLCFRNVFRTW